MYTTRVIVYQTVRLEIQPSTEVAAGFLKTRVQYAQAFDAVAEAGWKADRINGVELHKATYHKLRKQLDLPSQLVVSARMKAVEALKSARALEKSGKKVSRPGLKSPAVRFDARSYKLDWEKLVVKLTVIGGRVELPVRLSEYAAKFRGLKTASADLVYRKKRWFLHVVVEKEIAEVSATGHVVGVDRGIKRPAVTSDGQYFGKVRWRDIEERYVSLRRHLQAKGTKSAKRKLKLLGNRLGRFRRDCDHVLAKGLVASCDPGDTLVFEDLTHIRDRVKARGSANRRRLHAWSFHRLEAIVAYKAALAQVLVAKVDPRDTSRHCPSCGHTVAENRVTQSVFLCVRCGFERNADLVGSWNIRDRHRGLWSPEARERGPVKGPNVEEIVHFFCKPRALARGT